MRKLTTRTQTTSLDRVILKLSPIAAGCAVLLATSTGSVYAQEAQTTATETSNTVVVTGIRRGIEDAISAKRNSDMIIEAISAEDLGRLPDDSIADALATLPGVSAQYIGGRASTLNIRGLSGDFVNTTFNGREQASVGDNRAVLYDQYPAELISAAEVYKTADAELIGQGLAATVNLKTIEPLAFPGRAVQFKVMGEKNSFGELNPEVNSKGDRLSASYIDQFADRTIGVAFGYAHLDSPVEDKQQAAWGIGTGASPTAAPGYPKASSFQGAQWWADSTQSVRDGYMAVVEWRPNRSFTSTVDAYYSKSTSNEYLAGMQSGTNYANVTNATSSGGFLTGGDNLGLGGGSAYSKAAVVENNFTSESDHIFSIGWKNTYKVDEWTFVGDLSGSTASSQQNILETYSGTFAPSTVGFTASPYGGLNVFNPATSFTNPANVSLGDPGGWGQDGYDKFPQVTDKVRELRLSAERELDDGPFSSVAFGLNQTNRDKTRASPEYFVNFANNPISAQVPIPSNLITGVVNLPNGVPVLGINANSLVNSGLYYYKPYVHSDIYAKDWSVDEKITTGYGQLNINTTVAGVPVRGNVGVQVIHSNQSSDAYGSNFGVNPVVIPISGGASYNNVLPSLNLIASLPHDQELRLGLAEELQRPRFDDMNASNEATFSTTTRLWTSTAGNPELRPTLADALDLAYTKYFGKEGYISVAPYYKYLKTYIYTEAQTYDYAGYYSNGIPPSSNFGTATIAENGNGGKLEGLELTVSVPFDLITPALKGFGIDANASHGNSRIQTNVNGTTSASALPGFSQNVANMILYYTNGGFEIRYRESYRSAFLGEITGFGANLAYSAMEGVHNDSLQTDYEFKDGALKGLTVLFQVLNLNDPAYVQTQNYNNNTQTGMSQVDHYGRTYLLGINYKM